MENGNGWISVKDRLPNALTTVWISNGRGWTTLGCRSSLFDNGDANSWSWAASNGVVYEEGGSIESECQEADLDVLYWQYLPKPLSL